MENILAGTSGLKKDGSQVLVLNNASNSFSGGIELAAGTLRFASDAALGDSSNDITVSGNSTLIASTNNTVMARNVTLNAGVTLSFTEKNTTTISGTVTGAGGIYMNPSGYGSQSLILSSTGNTFSGPIKVGRDSAPTLTVNSLADSANPINLVLGNKGDTKFVYGAGAIAPLVFGATGRQVILSGNQTKSHVLENANTDPNNTITITKDLSITSTTSRKLVLQGVNTGSNTIAGIIPDGAGSVTSLEKNGTGTWVLAGANSYTGSTSVNDGLLVFANTSAKAAADVTVGANGSVGLGVGGTGYYNAADVDALYTNSLTGFNLNASSGVAIDTSAGDFTYASTIAGSRAFTKLGKNSLTLSGNNSYTGITTITAGTVLIDSTTTGQGSYTVEKGAALGGNGTIGLADNETITFAPGAKFAFDPNNTLTVSGNNVTVDVSELSIADILNLDASTPVGIYTLIQDASTSVTITATNDNWGVDNAYLLGGQTYAYFQPGSLQLNVYQATPVPEPSTAILAALGLMGLSHRRRRK